MRDHLCVLCLPYAKFLSTLMRELREGTLGGAMRRTTRLVLVAALLVAQTGLALHSPGSAVKGSSFSSGTHLLFLTGTDKPWKGAREYQDAYKYIANSLADPLRLGIAVNRQAILNYTNSNTAKQLSVKGWNLPAVITAKSKSGVKLMPGPNPKIIGCYQGTPNKEYFLDAWLNAYFTAWRIQRYLNENKGVKNVILVGHSQGGIIARIIQVISNPSSAPALTTSDSGLRKECWPNLTTKIKGIVTVGAPTSETACQGFSGPAGIEPFLTERRFIEQARWVAGNTLMIGADEREMVIEQLSPLNVLRLDISLSCATTVNATGSIRAAIYAQGADAEVISLQRESGFGNFRFGCLGGAYGKVRLRAQHTLRPGDSFTLSNHKPKLWNGDYKVLSVVSSGSEYEFCLPEEKGDVSAVSQLGIFRAVTLQQHTWYIEGGGKCPARVISPSPTTGKTEDWCAYKSRGPMELYQGDWKRIASKVAGANRILPGNIYDLIADVASKWAP